MRRLLIIVISTLAANMASSQKPATMFTKLAPSWSGVSFVNQVKEDDSLHVMKYEYLYNGHGVGVADFNDDGLMDLFFTGNQTASRLYKNLGNCKFEDITKPATIPNKGLWATGVSIADVNGDGLPDIYICHSGNFEDPAKLSNEFLINQGIKNGVPTFRDMATEYGLDAPGTQSTQAAFFDYDLDGDLDMFLLNHSNHSYNPFLNTRAVRARPDMRYGNRLFRNDQNTAGKPGFTDVTLSAGIINNALNFGLSVTVSDLNQDGWPDIYTTSDYTEKDCYYVNNRNGSFTESLERSFSHISKYSMGADIADYNNDGLADVYTLDMLPEDNYRQKLLKGPDEYDQYHLLLDSGYYHQQMRNMLQLNRGIDANGNTRFSEIGQLAGVSHTDWSWAGLFADFDNDGWKDLFVSNGYLRDFTNLDFLKYTVSNAQLEAGKQGNSKFRTFELVQKMPSQKLSSYIFRNNKELRFEDVTKSWGLYELAVSNGAAYADLDNDGDLDLIICRNNEPVAIYRNSASAAAQNHYIKIRLRGEGMNTAALGAKVWIFNSLGKQLQENYQVRGYQSTVSPELFFGLGKAGKIDSIVIDWPDARRSLLTQVHQDSAYTFDIRNAIAVSTGAIKNRSKLFSSVTNRAGIDMKHQENDFIDFKDEILIPYQLSKAGPALAKADVNGDGLDDVFVGGAIQQTGELYIQRKDGGFEKSESQPWVNEKALEDVNALFFDANGDKYPDLYVVSGGNEYDAESPEFQDRLYINDGKGNFVRNIPALPAMTNNKQAIAAADSDGDGDIDLFIGGRGIPGSYPLLSRSYLLRNDSKGNDIRFTDITKAFCPELVQPGMVTVAAWTDLNGDKLPELIIAGDWMPVRLFENGTTKFTEISIKAGLAKTSGMWSAIAVNDIDNDGDQDIVLGNAGLNLPFIPSPDKPATLYAADFDQNGRMDPLITYYIQDKAYPMASRDELLEQIPALRKKFVYYKDYAGVQITGIFSKQQLKQATQLLCERTESVILRNNGSSNFLLEVLPVETQFSRVQSILIEDFDGDNKKEILLAGNDFSYRVQSGRNDASFGVLLKASGTNKFEVVPPADTGLYISGDVRATQIVNTASGRYLVIARNNDYIQMEKIK